MISLNLSEAPNFTRPEILLHSTIPPSLFGVNPRTIKGKPWWDKVRQIAYAKNNYCCWSCGIPKIDAKYRQWLECHECYSFDLDTNVATFTEVVALCHSCHAFIHKGRLVQVEKETKVLDVLVHGAEILREAGLPCPEFVLIVLIKAGKRLYRGMTAQQMIEQHPNWGDMWTLSFEGDTYTVGGKVDG